MTISSLPAAKRLCEQSGWSLSNLELQKLLYIAHMSYLGKNDGEPLINGQFEAWNYGPVQPTVYHKVKIFGSNPVENIFRSVADVPSGDEACMLDDVIKGLGDASPGRLVAITHWEEGAWAKHYKPGLRGIVIPNDEILNEFRERERGKR